VARSRHKCRSDFRWLKYWQKPSPTTSAKPDGVGAVFSALDSKGRTIFVADAHRGDGKGSVVRADEKLTAFLELELAIRAETPLRH
jgi:hypothetical protein